MGNRQAAAPPPRRRLIVLQVDKCEGHRPRAPGNGSGWNFLDLRLAIASMAVGVIEHGPQHPVLLRDIPIAPRIARYVV